MKRLIKKVAVLGSGTMGSRIACHFANIGLEVLLLDMAPVELSIEEQAKGLELDNPKVKNRIVTASLEAASKANPSPVYNKSVLSRIKTGNFDDNMKDIGDCDWAIEVVVERLDIKKKIYDLVERYRRPGTLITSNTSGIPIHLMGEGRGEDFRAHFCGTHFFNPPRHLRLLEVIPTADTKPEVVDFLMHYGDRFLGKATVLCNDTPAFIANRVGVYAIMALFHLVEKMGLTVEETDLFTGPVLGRPKSATFRTNDVIGLDVMINVAKGMYDNCVDDKARELFKAPAYVQAMADKQWLGDKTKQGFYKKIKNADGTSEILALDFNTFEYKPQQKVASATIDAIKQVADMRERMRVYAKGTDKAGEFFRSAFYALFEYVADRIPEISDELYPVDDAMKAGFGWELGPFEVWDALGVKETAAAMKAQGNEVAAWVQQMLDRGYESFYKMDNGIKQYYDIVSKSYKAVPGLDSFIILDNIRSNKTVWGNGSTSIIDLGDGVINLEFRTKMNTINAEVLAGINKAIDLAEKEYRGLVIGNDGTNFSAGADLNYVISLITEQKWDELDAFIKLFQDTSMHIRYSGVPVVMAPYGLTLGGACEFSLHADHVQLHAETYMGLVEFKAGLIPGGGGTKEFALRASDEFKSGQIEQNILKDRFLTLCMAKVSVSAADAFDIGYLQKDKYGITMNRSRLLADAKAKAIELAEAGYVPPLPRKDIKVLASEGLGVVYIGANSMLEAGYISEYDKEVSIKLGYVICGGDLSAPTLVTEQYLLNLEREAFVSLCREPQTLEKIKKVLKKS